jgi:4-nitrophenyl phosphatase
MAFSEVRGVITDMDGVLWRGDEALPGLVDFFAMLRASGLPFTLATNNSSRTQADYVVKLAGMGVADIAPETIVTSGTATATYLQAHYPAGTPVHVFGGAGLHTIITEAGFPHTEGDEARVVIVGINRELTYETLWRAATLVRNGADFIGTNPDVTFPTPTGPAPGAGSLIAAIQTATDCEPLIIGKPAAPMFEAALTVLGTAPGETLMVGDRLNTDIAGAAALGIQTALVLTGISTRAELAASTVQPDAVYDDLPALLTAFG